MAQWLDDAEYPGLESLGAMEYLPRLYDDLASWWPLLSPPEHYAQEADWYRQILVDHCAHRPVTLLELGSGGGNNASYLKAHFRMTLVDLSPGMLAVSQALNPECEHGQGDMRAVRLGRTFDSVFVHDAIAYMASAEDLRQVVKTAYVHCRPGGVALFCPDSTRESFRPYTRHGGHDDRNRALRYLEWVWDPDPADSTYVVDFAYLLRDSRGVVRAEQDRHICGLFARADWLRFLAEAGFDPQMLTSDDDEEYQYGGGQVFVGIKRAATA